MSTPFLGDQLTVRRWASTLLRPVDEYGILPRSSHSRPRLRDVRKTSNQRRSIDKIVELAFSARLDRRCGSPRTSMPLELKKTIAAGNPDAESDTLVTIPSTSIVDKAAAF